MLQMITFQYSKFSVDQISSEKYYEHIIFISEFAFVQSLNKFQMLQNLSV